MSILTGDSFALDYSALDPFACGETTMEDLLLVLDEIDDLFAMAAAKWRSIASFLSALALFVFTGFAFLTIPLAAVAGAVVLVGWGMLEYVRERREAAAALAIAE